MKPVKICTGFIFSTCPTSENLKIELSYTFQEVNFYKHVISSFLKQKVLVKCIWVPLHPRSKGENCKIICMQDKHVWSMYQFS